MQDWDDAPGAIDWPRLVASLQEVRRTGALPASHSSHDHLNEQREVPVAEGALARWRAESERIAGVCAARGERVVWAIADGFLLYWSKVRACAGGGGGSGADACVQEVVEQLDVRVFLRVPHDVLVRRRHERHGYHVAGECAVSCLRMRAELHRAR